MRIGKVIRIIRNVPRPVIIKNWPKPNDKPILVPSWPKPDNVPVEIPEKILTR